MTFLIISDSIVQFKLIKLQQYAVFDSLLSKIQILYNIQKING